ncbi:dephospho-CoA kinase [Thiohalorhabdus sp.]|uniref:dephospho-CoA kinase n=1 Tax=Thiohalorhabdus sp. TaxID=3094134 RepID=UPI002FC30AC5
MSRPSTPLPADMLHVGLTGGIGAGKSSVSEGFRERGAHILDADQLARELTVPGSEALAEIIEAFGRNVLDDEGGLCRGRLAERVFADAGERQRLDAILHPRINALEKDRTAVIGAHNPHALVIYEAPLLLESGADRQVERILVVDLPEELQVERAIARGNRSADQVRAIMASQCSRRERLRRAHDVIDNSGPWQATARQIDALMAHYRTLAANGYPS